MGTPTRGTQRGTQRVAACPVVAVRELREVRDRLLQCTNQLSVDAALATIEDALRDRAELRSAEEAFATSLSSDGWRSVSAEVEASRHLEQRVRAFAGVQSKDAGSLEAALGRPRGITADQHTKTTRTKEHTRH